MLATITSAPIRIGEWEGLALECSPEALDGLRRLAVDGFTALPHGGLEVGGVLYGLREDDRIAVLSFAALECEHAQGPAFVLSEDDRGGFATLMRPPVGLEAVGWFRSHTRSDLELDADDRQIVDHFFDGAGTLALLLKPADERTVHAAVFLRPRPGDAPLPAIADLSLECARSGGGTAIAELAPAAAPREPTAPQRQVPEPHGARLAGRRSVILAAAAVLLVAALVVWLRPTGRIELRAYAVKQGQVRIQWNHRSRPVLDGASGVLEIRDGEASTRLPLDFDGIRSSTITYSQITGRIAIRLLVFPQRPGGLVESESIEFAGPVPAAAPAPARAPVARVEVQRDPPAAPSESPDLKSDTVVRVPVRFPEPHDKPIDRPAPRRAILQTAKSTSARAETALLPAPPPVGSNPLVPNLPELLRPVPVHPNPAPAPAPAASKAVAYSGPRSGRLIWTGSLPRRGVIEIEGARASVGSLIGGLPGVPLSVRVSPSEFGPGGLVAYTADPAAAGRREPRSKWNGWNGVHFELDAARAAELEIIEAPNGTNDYSRIVVRNQGRAWSVVLIDWAIR